MNWLKRKASREASLGTATSSSDFGKAADAAVASSPGKTWQSRCVVRSTRGYLPTRVRASLPPTTRMPAAHPVQYEQDANASSSDKCSCIAEASSSIWIWVDISILSCTQIRAEQKAGARIAGQPRGVGAVSRVVGPVCHVSLQLGRHPALSRGPRIYQHCVGRYGTPSGCAFFRYSSEPICRNSSAPSVGNVSTCMLYIREQRGGHGHTLYVQVP